MAGSSGTYQYSLSNGEAVLAAYDRVEVRAPMIRQEHMLTARREINDLFVELSNRGVNLWKVQLNSINLTQGNSTYPVPSNVVMILDSYRAINFNTSTQTNIYMTPISRTEYASYPQPQNQAPPTVYWFDRLISPTVTMWPTPDGNGPYVFNYYAAIQLQDANLPNGETPDLPYRWLGVLLAGLARRLGRVYRPAGVDIVAWRNLLKAEFDEAWDFAAVQDTENTPVVFAPQISGYFRR